mmetsp:Transcript_38112/g.98415  ORF Transcript_38112/g.98415 Transcript_38112/m.98415 type:complete len:146 (-) Transcript_38112:42-479(-)
MLVGFSSLAAKGGGRAIRRRTGGNLIVIHTRIDENELEKVETSDSTYIADPRGEGYAEYRRSFHLKSGRGRIENVLATNAAVSAKYNSLVKTKKVDEELFWARYLFAIDDMHRRAEKKEELRRGIGSALVRFLLVHNIPSSLHLP